MQELEATSTLSSHVATGATRACNGKEIVPGVMVIGRMQCTIIIINGNRINITTMYTILTCYNSFSTLSINVSLTQSETSLFTTFLNLFNLHL